MVEASELKRSDNMVEDSKKSTSDKSKRSKDGELSCLQQTASLEFPLPNEIIENILLYLSSEDLLSLGVICSKRLRTISYKVLRKKPFDLPELLCRMSEKGDLENVKQIFKCVKKENIKVDEMGVKKNKVNQGKILTLVDNNNGFKGRSPLIEAAKKGHTHICEYLISQQNANIEVKDNDQATALNIAALYNQTEVTKLLLDHDANIKAQNRSRGHATYWAARFGHLEVLKLLLEKDRDVIDIKDKHGVTPLIVASFHGKFDVCKHLVTEKNAGVNIQNNVGDTALHWAAYKNHIDIVDVLLENGAKDLKNEWNQTALTIAKEKEHREIVKKLEQYYIHNIYNTNTTKTKTYHIQ